MASVSANVKMSEIARMELTHLRERASSTETPWRWCKEIVKGGNSERDIRNERVGLFHSGYSQGIVHCPNTVRRYLKDPEAVMPKRRRRRSSKLDPYIEYMDRRLSEGLENCVVLWRELQGLGTRGATPW